MIARTGLGWEAELRHWPGELFDAVARALGLVGTTSSGATADQLDGIMAALGGRK